MIDNGRLFFTFDGDTMWLDHYPSDDSEETCAGSPVCSIAAGDTLEQVLRSVDDHVCAALPEDGTDE